MRLVYLDEAGISNPKHEPFAVVAGIIIHADSKLIAVERYLDRLVDRYIPEEHRDGFVFHATELFNGGGKVFTREHQDALNPIWPLNKRLAIADELAKVPARFRLDIALGWIERSTFAEEYGLPADIPPAALPLAAHVFAFFDCSMRVEQWMRQRASNEVCLMIVEDNDRETQLHYQDRRLSVDWTSNDAIYFPFRKNKEEPLFQRKRRSSALQVADFAAYVFKRVLMGDARYERFYRPMQQMVFVPGDERRASKGGGKHRRCS